MTEERGVRPVVVRIGGEEVVLRAPVPEEHLRECARMVDRALQEIRERGGAIDPARGLLLAALSVADELIRARAASEEARSGPALRDAVRVARIEAVLERLDSLASRGPEDLS